LRSTHTQNADTTKIVQARATTRAAHSTSNSKKLNNSSSTISKQPLGTPINLRVIGPTPVCGGDAQGCLDAGEIDEMLRGRSLPPADLFYRYEEGKVSANTVYRGIVGTGGRIFVLYCRHHWLACRVRNGVMELWDSAPSPIVRRDIVRICRTLSTDQALRLVPVFSPSPRQQRHSTECGLFALARCFLGDADFGNAVRRCASLRPFVASRDPHGFEREARQVWTDDAFRLDADRLEVCPEGSGNTKCTARKQLKRGGQTCTNDAVTTRGPPLCRLHFLLSLAGDAPCQVKSKAGRPCSHKAVSNTYCCPFHVTEGDYHRLLRGHNQEKSEPPGPIDQDHEAPSPVDSKPTEAPSPAKETTAEMVATLNDPDFEDELAFLASPMGSLDSKQAANSVRTLGDLLAVLRTSSRKPVAHPLALQACEKTTLEGHGWALRMIKENAVSSRLDHLPLVT